MIPKYLSRKSLLVLVTSLAAVCITCFGMRVPDLSRLHLPKPIHRAVVEKQVKPGHQAVKKALDLVALPAAPVEPVPLQTYRAYVLSAFPVTGAHPLFPNFSRAPPLFSA